MLFRSVKSLAFFFLFIAVAACKNEPYSSPALGISALRGVNPTSNRSFHYKAGRVDAYTFSQSSFSTSAKVSYKGDQIYRIVADSSATSKKVSVFYYNGLESTDTLKLIDTGVHILQVRKVTHDESGQLSSVVVTTFGATETIHRRADLRWVDGNVTHLVVSDPTLIENNVLTDIVVTHVDDKPGIYASGTNQFLGLNLEELFWLSKKNPETITLFGGTTEILYWYNKLGYPSAFQVGTTTFNVGYVQVYPE